MAGEKGPIAAGPLKLKGVQSSRVEKKKKKKKKPKSGSNDKTPAAQSIDAVDIAKESDERKDITQAANEDEDEDEIDTPLSASKTEAQLKHEEMRRKRVSIFYRCHRMIRLSSHFLMLVMCLSVTRNHPHSVSFPCAYAVSLAVIGSLVFGLSSLHVLCLLLKLTRLLPSA